MTFKQVPPNLVLNKTIVTKVNSLAIQSDQKAIAAGKQKNSLLKAKVISMANVRQCATTGC